MRPRAKAFAQVTSFHDLAFATQCSQSASRWLNERDIEETVAGERAQRTITAEQHPGSDAP
jgi:hypothetical protein